MSSRGGSLIAADHAVYSSTLLSQAKKLIGEKSPGYMTARSAMRDLKAMRDDLRTSAFDVLAVPPEWTEMEKENVGQ